MRFKKFVAGLLAATSLVAVFGGNVMADDSIAIVNYVFQDAELRALVKTYDTNNDGYLSDTESKKLTSIDFNGNKNISRLDGIKSLKYLETVKISRTNIKELDVDGMGSLKYIEAQKASLTSIDVTGCTALIHLDLYATKLNRINITSNVSLKYLDIVETNIKHLDIIYNEQLKTIYNTVTPYEKTWISKPSLCYGDYTIKDTFLGYNKDCTVYTSCPEGWIDLSAIENDVCYEVLSILCHDCDVNGDYFVTPEEIQYGDSIFISAIEEGSGIELLTGLKSITFMNPHLTSFDASRFPLLEELEIATIPKYECSIKSVNLKGNTKLKLCYLRGLSNLTSVTLGDNSELENLYIVGCPITSIDLSSCPNLTGLSLIDSEVKTVDISNNPKLIDLYNTYYPGKKYTVDEIVFNYEVILILYAEDEYAEQGIAVRADAKIVTEKPSPTPTPKPTAKPTATPTKVPGATTTPAPTVKPGSAATPTKAPGATSAPKPTSAPGAKPTTTPSNPSNPSVPSDNGVGGFIDRLYTVALGRDFDEGGKNYWTNEIKVNGQTGADIARQFLYSEEFLGKNMSQDDFLTVLYRTFFDREPDASGLKYWKDQMSAGQTKEWVIAGFINSEEWANICLSFGIRSGSSVAPTITITPNENVIGFATRLYTTCLKRDFDPEGLDFWAKELANLRRTGSEAAKGFFFSEEIAKSGISDSEFLTRLYKTLMNREPEKEGFDYWLGQMKSGAMSRESVFDGFAASEEWVGICADYGILR